MATEKEASLQSCASDPNFAVICSFLNQFAASCGIAHPTFSDLQEMLEDTEEVSQVLIDLHIKLLRKARKSFTADKWEKALAKFCHTYSQQDGWELERFGYKKSRLGVKVKLLKVLLETQFDVNGKFKSEVNKVGAKDLRLEPLGRDQNGFQYWCQFDKSSHVRIYREDLDDETWEMVASDRDGLVQLIDSLSNGEGQQELNSILNEDSTSQEIEKPITDTGQEDDKLEEGVDGDDEGGDEEEEEEEEVEEEEEEVEEGEEEEEEEEGDDEEDVKEENKVEKEVEKKAEQKAEPVPAKPVVAVQEQEKPVELTNGSNVVPPPEENVSSLTGVDLSIKSDSKRYLPAPNDYYTSVPERPYMPERNDILSQMSARFNDPREAEDLSFSPAKKLRLEDDDQPMMLVKKDIVVSDAIEEPVRLVTGPGSGEDCQQGNPSKEPEFSEVIEEPVQYVVGIGSGVDCDAPNPKYGRNLDVRNLEDEESAVEEEPEFSEVIEEPVLFIVGLGSGVECEIGNPQPCNEGETSSSYSASTLGIECSLKTLSLASREPKFSDVIEEPVMFVHGSGSGQDCLTGNPDEVDESIDDKSPEKKPKLWSIDAICSSEKLLNESLKQNSSGSSQKDPECDEGSSKMSEGALNCTKENVADEENGSAFNLSNNINSSLKPFSGVKPILENIPMKDKPPDDTEPDTSNLVPEISNDISSRNFDKIEGNSNCMSNIEEEAGSNRALTSESIPPSARVEDLNDVSSSNCTSEEKSTEGDQPSATNCTVNSCLLPASTDCDLKSLSEDNSRTSMISEDSVEDKNSSELNDGLSKLDNDSCHNVNNAKSNSKKSSSTKSSKITTDSNNKKSTADDGEVKCDINNSLSEKCESDDQVNSLIIDKNNLENCENGSKLMSNCSVVLTDISLPDQNLSASKTSKHKSSTVSSSGNDELKTDSDKSNPASSDKNEEKRKNVMLTNIIEVCLDNDNYGKDDAKSGLKGQLNAKFNDLFSAKNLLEPTTRSISKETCNELKEVPTSDISENCTKSDSSDEKIKAQEEQKINPDVNIKDENCENIKQEENINEEASQDVSTSKPESEDKIQSENCDPVKQEEVKEENSVRNVARGRKSRTNSLNNDEETEIPNKIRKTDSVPKARRVTRRNASSNSLNSVSSEPTDDKVVNVKESKTKVKNDSNTEKEPVNEVNLNEEKTENKTEQKDQNNEAVDDEVKVKEEEKKDEATKEIPKTETDETDHISNQENEGIEKKNIQENKGFTLASFSLEQPLEDGPVLGKPPDFKSQPTSRKRRNSRKLSRSEEDGGDADDKDEDVEEAGGKKPRLRAKTRRSKGTPPSTKHVQPEASSSDDNQAEENTDLNSKDKRRPKGGRPMKKKGKSDSSATSKSKPGKAKESEKNKEKGSDSEDEDESESEKEDAKQIPAKKGTKTKETDKEESEKEEKKQPANEKADKKQIPKKGAKSKSKGKGRFNKGGRPKKEPQSNKEETAGDDTSNGAGEDVEEGKDTKTEAVESKGEEDNDSKSAETEEPKPKKKGRPKKQKTLLGLMESDLIHSKPSPNDSEEGSRVRQSRRIAQIKIKEEAERRAIEEATMMLTMKEAKKKPKEESKLTPKKQKKKNGKKEKVSEEEDETFKEPVEDKKKGRKKKKKKGLTYDINKPWQSSSDDSSEEAEEEEEHFEEEDDEEDIRASKVVSDHEFSPESDLEKDDTIEPVRRARTAKKADEDEIKDEETEVTEDYACKKCGQPDHPEWILLCDKCDSGYHASCLRPTLMLIPEGDWFCPPCQHLELVSKLKETLRAFEKNTKRRENEELRKKRLAYVGISLANVLPTQDKTSPYSGGRRIMSESSESSSEESESSDEEPVYQLRQRRAALQANYRFNDYDELINSAIQDEMEAVKGAGNMGRGKDIANIVEAEKKAAQSEEAENAEEEPKPEEEEEQGENWRPPVVPKNTSLPSLRKKPKKLTDLDKQSEDDADSDEDFKGSSDDEEFSSTEGGDSDDSLGRRQPVRRSSRARTSRIDKEFINDDSESSDEPRRKKTRRIWASSSSESSDTTWGRRKRKTKTYSRIRSSKSSRKKKKMVFDSDSDRPKKTKTKRPKIRYGLSEDEGEPLRRTRGKKMSYLEVAGSDTEEEVIARSRKLISEDEDEFVPEKEEAGDDEPEEVEPVEEVEEEEEEDDDDENEEEEEDEADEPKAEEKDKVEIEKKENEKNEEKPLEKETVKVPVPPVPETQNKDAVKEPEPVQEIEPEKTVEEEDDDDQVEEEEIEEEVEEEVEEEEEEEEEEDDDSQIDEVKNLAREKVEEPKGIIQPPIKIGSGISIIKVPLAPAVSTANSTSTVPPPAPPAAAAIPTPVIKEEKKEEKKEPTPAIRLVPSAKLLDPNKRRPPEESVIRGMLGGGYYRPPPMQAPGRQPFRQRFPDQQRYLYQPPPASHHQFFPGSAFYASEDYVVGSGYEEQVDPNAPGGDEEGVFSGLVSYFSSQREDNLDS